MKAKSIADATILSLGAILEALPPKAQQTAQHLAREYLDRGYTDDAQTERMVRGIFLLDEPA